MKNKFYVTTPIYYATAKPHLGSLYSIVLADISAKWNKLNGKQVFLLTGTDEHGQKIALEAQKAGKEPQEFVNDFISQYKHIWKLFEIDYNVFIRTTDEFHKKAVQKWIAELLQKGDIYKDTYKGWYCTPCETFVTEEAQETTAPSCLVCVRQTTFISEESYFFRLSAYQDKLLQFYKENPDFITPKDRINEVIKFVQSGLKDLSISRTSVKWGIPFPGDDKHIVYVWADALLNYVSAIGYTDESKKDEFNFWWPADLQVMGKDIVRFHAVFWPAFLMASNLKLPKKLLVHGWIKVNQQKMSKSLGNTIDPEILYNTYGADAIRYYLSSQLSITQDAEFSTQALERHISTDLANDLGNLLNRMITLASKNNLLEVPEFSNWSDESKELQKSSISTLEEFSDYMEKNYYHLAIATLWRFIGKVNSYFHAHEPWKLANNNPEKFKEIISATCHSLNFIGTLIWPVMPVKSQELLNCLGKKITFGQNNNKITEILNSSWSQSFILKSGPTLFQKIEEPTVSKENQNNSMQTQTLESTENNIINENITHNITIDEFIKTQLVVGTIQSVEPVIKSDKLLKLQVDFGPKGQRQILSGIAKHFTPDSLIGKKVVFVYNLAPRKMMGLDSHGMLLTAQTNADKLELINISSDVANGTQLK